MAVEITVPGGSNARFLPYAPSITSGLRGCYIFGGTLAQSKRNHAPGGADLTAVGAPVVESTYARLTGMANYFDTGLVETSAMTYVAVSRAVNSPTDNATSAAIIGNFRGSAVGTYGNHLTWTDSGGADRVSYNVGTDNGGALATESVALNETVTDWDLIVAGTDGTASSLYNLTDDLSNIGSAYSNSRAAVTSDNLLIGSFYTSFAGEVDIQQLWVFDRLISGSERAAIAVEARALATADNITV